MAKKHEYVQTNLKIINQLVRSGDVKCSLVTEFQIYRTYMRYEKVEGKMLRYQHTADDERTSVAAVMRAVKNMESPM